MQGTLKELINMARKNGRARKVQKRRVSTHTLTIGGDVRSAGRRPGKRRSTSGLSTTKLTRIQKRALRRVSVGARRIRSIALKSP